MGAEEERLLLEVEAARDAVERAYDEARRLVFDLAVAPDPLTPEQQQAVDAFTHAEHELDVLRRRLHELLAE